MTTTLQGGPRIRTLNQDEDGFRNYEVTHLVRSDDRNDGPLTVLGTAGVPSIGSVWSFGNDNDSWAFCLPTARVTKADDAKWPIPEVWKVTQKFSTKPIRRCQNSSVDNPLLEPQKVSGSFVKYTTVPFLDKDGDPIVSSSHEFLRLEFDANRPTVTISQNVGSLELDTFTEMVDTVNNAPLWGLAARKIKLSNASWERNIYGTCNYYYTRTFEFDVSFGTFDRTVLDNGLMVLKPGGDKNDPTDFIRAKDDNDENTTRLLLDGNGAAADSRANAARLTFEYYEESNFLLLGIPTVLDP
jgi:hypothetical protein